MWGLPDNVDGADGIYLDFCRFVWKEIEVVVPECIISKSV